MLFPARATSNLCFLRRRDTVRVDPMIEDRKELTYPVLTAVLGPLTWRTEWMAEAVFEGRPIWIERVITRTRLEHGFHLAAFVGRPVQLGVYTRHNTSGVGPELSTGDAQFDAAYILTGSPADVVLAAFDADMRRWVLGLWYPHQPDIHMEEDGFLRVYRHMPSRSELRFGQATLVGHEELAAKARGIQRLAARLAGQPTTLELTVPGAPASGDAAAWSSFLQHKANAENARQKRVWTFAIVAVVGVGVIIVALVGVLLAVLLFSTLLR